MQLPTFISHFLLDRWFRIISINWPMAARKPSHIYLILWKIIFIPKSFFPFQVDCLILFHMLSNAQLLKPEISLLPLSHSQHVTKCYKFYSRETLTCSQVSYSLAEIITNLPSSNFLNSSHSIRFSCVKFLKKTHTHTLSPQKNKSPETESKNQASKETKKQFWPFF